MTAIGVKNFKRCFQVGYSTTTGDIGAFTWGDVIETSDAWQQFEQDYPVGTPLTIFDDDGKWVYIDIEGRHCKLKRTFMIYDNTAMSEAK